MGIAVNDVFRIRLTMFDSASQGYVMNVLNYRLSTGSTTDPNEQQGFEDLITAFKTAVWDVMKANLTELVELRKLQFRREFPTKSYLVTRKYDTGAEIGALASASPQLEQMAACLVRKSYKAGRQGIGRFFFGPLDDRFRNLSEFVEDPALGGDLSDVKDALWGNVSTAGAALVMKPCIVPPNVVAIDSQNDVREQIWATRVTPMRSRRIGIGM